MATATVDDATRPAAWMPLGSLMHPDLRRALKAKAALEGDTMQQALHRVLVRALRQEGYVLRLSGEERPA